MLVRAGDLSALRRAVELMRQIVLNLAEFRSIVGGKTLAYKINGERIELTIAPISWVDLIRAVLDAMKPNAGPRSTPPDPPEAAEFLPRGSRRK
jgi:hypothetical protein